MKKKTVKYEKVLFVRLNNDDPQAPFYEVVTDPKEWADAYEPVECAQYNLVSHYELTTTVAMRSK